MKKLSLIAMLVLLMPAYAGAFDLPFFGGDKDKAESAGEEVVEKGKRTYLIHFKSGGTIETDNYSIKGDNVIVVMPSGAIYLDRKMVSSIEEVKGPERETVNEIQVQPDEAAPRPAPSQKKPAARPAPEAAQPSEDLDDLGHNEKWWKDRIALWRGKKAEAEQRYAEAEQDWNRYNGQLQSLDPDQTSEYDISRYQDLRGSSRVAMDRAQGDMKEAENMLNNVIPDEARKAGAPPGWLR